MDRSVFGRTGLLWIGLLPALVAPPAAGAPQGIERIEQALAAGDIDFDHAARQQLFFLFDRSRLDAAYKVDGDLPEKGATIMIHKIAARSNELSAATRALLDGYLDIPGELALAAAYDTPGGHFRITYQSTGPNAPPPADVDPPNGIPDFVERAGDYFETVWAVEIDALGYPPPPIGGGRYSITLQELGAGFYGYTNSGGVGSTHIVIDNDFAGFPPNDDPDGDAPGAAKVTAAHEFRHASQYVGSGWSEGDWVETDATWIEDMVFDQTNDYYNFINSSQIRFPGSGLDPGSYDDCIWQHYMSETHGPGFVLDVWNRRRSVPSEPMLTTYSTIFDDYGGTLQDGFGEYMTWNLQCGSHANGDNPGYEEAAGYLSSTQNSTHASYPVHVVASTVGLGGRFIRFVDLPATDENLRIGFDGPSGVEFRNSVIWREDSGAWGRIDMVLDAQSDGDATVPAPVSVIAEAFLVVANGNTDGSSSSSYDYAAELLGPTGIRLTGAPPGAVRLGPAVPNPFHPSTVIRYELGEDAPVRLDIFDAGGRLVRNLVSARLPAGEHQVEWDGTGLDGRPAASGAYFYRLRLPGHQAVRQLTLVK